MNAKWQHRILEKKHNPRQDMCTAVSVDNAAAENTVEVNGTFITVSTCTTWYTACESKDDGKEGKKREDEAGSKRGSGAAEEFQRYCVLPLSPSDK